MAEYISFLKTDLPEQFKDKEIISYLMEAVGEQLNEVYEFMDDLKNLRSVYTAIGKQLDGVGDIVALTRKEATALASTSQSIYSIEDEVYRAYLIYKIWKNSCNCTYSDVMKSIEMFWTGPTLYFTEEIDSPATIIFDWDAASDFDVANLSIPFIKAGGVGIKLRMHNTNNELTIYMGLALAISVEMSIDCEEPTLEEQTYLTTEDESIILTDERGNWLSL